MKMLVYGGRDYADRKKLFEVLDKIHAETPVTTVIEGDARGADRLAKRWAEARGIKVEDFPADWDDLAAEVVMAKKRPDGSLYNAAAGNNRNLLMLAKGKPDIAVEFPGGKGTANMRRLVRMAQKRWALRYVLIE